MEFVYLSPRHTRLGELNRKQASCRKTNAYQALVTDIYLIACHKQKMWIKGRKGKEGAVSVQGSRSALHQGSLLDQGMFCHIVLHQQSCEMMEPNAE